MKPHIHEDITRPGRPTTFSRLIDLRQPLIPALSPKTPALAIATPAPAPTSQLVPLHQPWPWSRLFRFSIKLGLVLGLSVILLSLGISLPERLIAIYALAALFYAIDSQRTLLIALLFVASVALWSILGRPEDAQNNAVYAFYFLVIGLVSAAREVLANSPQARKP